MKTPKQSTKSLQVFALHYTSHVYSPIQVYNFELNIDIESKIEKLQTDLAAKNNLMYKLSQKTEKTKLLLVKLTYANKHLEDLELEKIVLKSFVSEVNQYLQNIVETHDLLLTVSVRQHLAYKIKPVFSIMNIFEGVLERDVILKQGGDDKEQPKQNTGEPTRWTY